MIEGKISKYPLTQVQFDVVVVGGGGAGLMCAADLARGGVKVCCVSKMHPLRSNTVSAQGGIAATLGNVHEDNWEWHCYDTIKSGAGLSDEDSVFHLCKSANEAVLNLESFGVPFSRLDNGKIYQRRFGGMTTENGKVAGAYRTCAASDKTGHAILHTLYQQCLKFEVDFFSEFFVIDIIMRGGAACGIVCWDIVNGGFSVFSAKVVVLATGGYSRVYKTCTASYSCTGDSLAMVLRSGLPAKDAEFVQFHPTGLYGIGSLVSEAIRSEGGFLLNKNGERFMEKYSPLMKDLATRDFISQCIVAEIIEGRGCGEDLNHVMLDARGIPGDVVRSSLFSVKDMLLKLKGVDMERDLIPVLPTAHYSMGGIPTDLNANVLDKNGIRIEGLMAIGEAACVSVHGANRLGSNSLLELIVFGSVAAKNASLFVNKLVGLDSPIEEWEFEAAVEKVERILFSSGESKVGELRLGMQSLMESKCGIRKDEAGLSECIAGLESIAGRLDGDVGVSSRGMTWNDNLVEALELQNLLLCSLAVVKSAFARKESRGAHFRSDFLSSEESFRKHTIATMYGKVDFEIRYQDVRSASF